MSCFEQALDPALFVDGGRRRAGLEFSSNLRVGTHGPYTTSEVERKGEPAGRYYDTTSGRPRRFLFEVELERTRSGSLT